MRKIRSWITLLFFTLIINIPCSLKADNFVKEKRVYLWDVTLSMKGYGGTPNIWDDVVKSICDNINSIVDEDTEIVVLPYQVDILEEWKVKASPEGKRLIISKIKNYKNDQVTNNDNYTPFNKVMKSHIDSNKRNVLFLLTDGKHNVNKPSINDLYALISKWCLFAKTNNSYAFYVMLTEHAVDQTLKDFIDESCRITSIPPGETFNFLEIRNDNSVLKYNIRDDIGKSLKLNLSTNVTYDLPNDIQFKLDIESNDYFSLSETVSLNQMQLAFKLNQISKEELKRILPFDKNEKLKVSITLTPETLKKYPFIQYLSNDYFEIELINKLERTLKISIE